jgi:hypothetical protein
VSNFDENEAIDRLPFDREVYWSNGSLNMDEAEFNALYGRLERLEALGRIEILDSDRESYTGQRFIVKVKFQRIR